jgi:aquaporin NIP
VTSGLVERVAAEAVGTGILVAIGTGAIVEGAKLGGVPQAELAVAWFAAVLLPILLVIDRSGAHLNPAVTLALAASGRISWEEAPPYWAGQFAGAFLGTALVLALLGDDAHVGATVPGATPVAEAFGLEVLFTAALVGAVFTLADRGEGPGRWRVLLPPAVVGLSTYVIGPLTGSSLNPARSVAPAVISLTFSGLWIYLLAPLLAALTVALVWRPRAVDRLDRGPGRLDVSR